MPVCADIGIYALDDCRIIDCVIARNHAIDKILMRRVYAGIQHGNAHRVKGGEPRLIRHFPHSIEKRRRHVCITDLRIGGGCSEIFGNPRRLKGIVISDRFDVRHFFIAHGFFIRAVYQQHVAAERTSAVHCFEHFQCARTGKFKDQSVTVPCRIADC